MTIVVVMVGTVVALEMAVEVGSRWYSGSVICVYCLGIYEVITHLEIYFFI